MYQDAEKWISRALISSGVCSRTWACPSRTSSSTWIRTRGNWRPETATARSGTKNWFSRRRSTPSFSFCRTTAGRFVFCCPTIKFLKWTSCRLLALKRRLTRSQKRSGRVFRIYWRKWARMPELRNCGSLDDFLLYINMYMWCEYQHIILPHVLMSLSNLFDHLTRSR